MVSANTSPIKGYALDAPPQLLIDPSSSSSSAPTPPMALPGSTGPLSDAAAATPGSPAEDPSKKIRKPYTITKSRESWTDPEHDRFLEALQLFDRDWKKIEAFVGSKSVIQIRSHAQKYFLKVQKNGKSEHVPPPRPKRKAAHPYPQKASKSAPPVSQSMPSVQASSLNDLGYAPTVDTSSMLRNSTITTTLPSAHSSMNPVNASKIKVDMPPLGTLVANNCSGSSTESPSGTWPVCEMTYQENNIASLRVMPNFSQVYKFLGNIFDPDTTDHLQKLKEMDPVDVETVLLLMRNLSINLTNPEFEIHKKLLSSYGGGTEEVKAGCANDIVQANRSVTTPFMVKTE